MSYLICLALGEESLGLRNSKDFVASGSNRLTGSNANTSTTVYQAIAFLHELIHTRLLPPPMNSSIPGYCFQVLLYNIIRLYSQEGPTLSLNKGIHSFSTTFQF